MLLRLSRSISIILVVLGGMLSAQDHPVPRVVEEFKAKIESDNRNNPKKSVIWAEQMLAQIDTDDVKSRLWFLAALSRDSLSIGELRKSFDTAQKGLKLSSSNVDKARFGILIARALHVDLRTKEAFAEIQKVVPQFLILSVSPEVDAKQQAASGFRLLGSIQSELGNFAEAMDAFTKSLKIYDALGDSRGQSLAHDSLANLHMNLGHYKEAEVETLKALQYAEHSKDKGLVAGFHLSLSATYSKLKDYTRSKLELEKAYYLAVRSDDRSTALTAMVNLADIALQLKDYQACIKHADNAILLCEEVKDQASIAVCYINKGISLNRLSRPGGIALIQKGLDYFKSIDAQIYVPEITELLAKEHAFNKDFESAYNLHVKFKELNDALIKREDQKQIAETQAAYQSEKQQIEIENLQKEKRTQAKFRILGVLFSILCAATTVILIYGRLKLKKVNKTLEAMALRDPLTGLANRRYLAHRIGEDMAYVDRLHRLVSQPENPAFARMSTNIDMVFMMVDIDHFKHVNDEYGHAAGDAVLKQFSQLLSKAMRDSDTVVRWGGEEFFVLAKQSSYSDAHILAERIRTSVAAHPFVIRDGITIHKTCSIGFTCYPLTQNHEANWETLVDMADQCLYTAKNSGRDLWVGLMPCREDLLGSPMKITAGMNVMTCVKTGAFDVRCTEGRNIVWQD